MKFSNEKIDNKCNGFLCEVWQQILLPQAYPLLGDDNILSVGLGYKSTTVNEETKYDTEEVVVQFTVSEKFDSDNNNIQQTYFIPPVFSAKIGNRSIELQTDVIEVKSEIVSPTYNPLALPSFSNQIVIKGRNQGCGKIDLGAPLFDRSGNSYYLTAAHVIGETNIVRDEKGNPIGEVVKKITPTNAFSAYGLDVAVIRLYDTFESNIIPQTGTSTCITEPRLGDTVKLAPNNYKDSTQNREGQVARVMVIRKINGLELFGFDIQPLKGKGPEYELTQFGDSGSIWWIESKNKKSYYAAGLHIAGEKSGTQPEFAFASYLPKICKQTGLAFRVQDATGTMGTQPPIANKVNSVRIFPSKIRKDSSKKTMDGGIPVLPKPKQVHQIAEDAQFELKEGSALVQADKALKKFKIDGSGKQAGLEPTSRRSKIISPAVVILDTGIASNHPDFDSRVVDSKDFTQFPPIKEANDKHGHGTHVAGIIAASYSNGGTNQGIAPGAKIIPFKISDPRVVVEGVSVPGNPHTFTYIARALKFLLNEGIDKYEKELKVKIVVISISIGDEASLVNDTPWRQDSISRSIKELTTKGIAVVAASGNEYNPFAPKAGMNFPAILRECISVGAVYDADIGPRSYGGGAITVAQTGPDQITPFSQRLPRQNGNPCYTTIFAPGSHIQSSGLLDEGSYPSTSYEGTSQATPIVAGAVLLMQDYYNQQTHKKEWLSVEQIKKYLEENGDTIQDENQTPYKRLNLLATLEAIQQDVEDDPQGDPPDKTFLTSTLRTGQNPAITKDSTC